MLSYFGLEDLYVQMMLLYFVIGLKKLRMYFTK